MIFDDCSFRSTGPQNPCSYAQYGVQSNPPSNSDIPMFVVFQEGKQISLQDTKIVLAPGYLYLIDFILSATPESDSYMQITPKINGELKLLYSFFAPAGSGSRNTSASGSFTIPVKKDTEQLSFYLTYPNTVKNIDLSGVVCITALRRIKKTPCGCSE